MIIAFPWLLLLVRPLLADTVELKVRVPAGRELLYRLHTRQSSWTETPPAAPRWVQSDVEAEVLVRAQPGEETPQRLEWILTRLRLEQQAGGRKVPLVLLRPGEQIRLQLGLDERGAICESRVVEGEPMSGPIRRLAEALARSLENLWLPLPEGPVASGDHWDLRRVYPLLAAEGQGLALTVSGRITFTGTEDCQGTPCARLEAAFTCASQDRQERDGVAVQTRLEGQGRAEVWLLVEEGIWGHSRSQVTLAGEIGVGQPSDEVTSRVRLEAQTDMELIP